MIKLSFNLGYQEILALTLNGAGIALGSTAFVEVQPDAKMTMTMMTGCGMD